MVFILCKDNFQDEMMDIFHAKMQRTQRIFIIILINYPNSKLDSSSPRRIRMTGNFVFWEEGKNGKAVFPLLPPAL